MYNVPRAKIICILLITFDDNLQKIINILDGSIDLEWDQWSYWLIPVITGYRTTCRFDSWSCWWLTHFDLYTWYWCVYIIYYCCLTYTMYFAASPTPMSVLRWSYSTPCTYCSQIQYFPHIYYMYNTHWYTWYKVQVKQLNHLRKIMTVGSGSNRKRLLERWYKHDIYKHLILTDVTVRIWWVLTLKKWKNTLYYATRITLMHQTCQIWQHDPYHVYWPR